MTERVPPQVLGSSTTDISSDCDTPASETAATSATAPDGSVEPIEPLLSNEDICTIFGRGDRTIRRWIAAGHLRPIRVGGAVFYHPADVRTLIARRLRR